MEEIRIDMRKQTPEEREQGVKDAQLCFNLNHTMPYTMSITIWSHSCSASSERVAV